jgi:hypothetical protein
MTKAEKQREAQPYISVPKQKEFFIGACSVTAGIHSTGVQVVKFKSGNKVISKMARKDATPNAISEELENLKYMNLCR